MDETGILEGLGCNGLVLGSSEKKEAIKKRLGSRCWTTIVECVSATGQALTPLVIFKGQDLQQQWFPDELDFLKDWDFVTSPKGWTSDSIAIQWLKQVFIPQTRRHPQGNVLLIVDGHGSH
ncbi:DDE superfamily endonuclease [Hirsutella rhossiliensis]